ncbi:Uncharacterized protein Adt_39263 [Abeliophyllum distichum]|uniref:Uncharacterized protein n=1 Tax=Abeliophyllum distichum TaxID=126358 RepID=A0ABD1Q5M5_9LAMI
MKKEELPIILKLMGPHSEKPCKGFSSKDKSSRSRSDLDKTINNVADSSLELDHMISYEEKSKSEKSKFDEKCATLDKAKKNIIFNKVVAGRISKVVRKKVN